MTNTASIIWGSLMTVAVNSVILVFLGHAARTGMVVGTSWSGWVSLLFPYVSDFSSPGPTGITLALLVTAVPWQPWDTAGFKFSRVEDGTTTKWMWKMII